MSNHPDTATTYVMVPVPADLTVEVQQYVVRLMWSSTSMTLWTTDALLELFAKVDDRARLVLRSVAVAKLSDQEVEDVAMAQSAQIGVRELLGLVREINDSGDPTYVDLIVFRRMNVTEPSGEVRQRRWATMIEEHARRVLEADDDHRRRTPVRGPG